MPYCNEFIQMYTFRNYFWSLGLKKELLTLSFSDCNLSEHHPAVESRSEKELK